jgi:DnaJ family protein C protein 8
MAEQRKTVVMTSEAQLERLCSREKWVNPYEVLLLNADASEEEIRSKFRKLSVLVHPDKVRDDQRTLQAFHIVESAYKTLIDTEKKKIYQRIMREARERVEFERKKENLRRAGLGLAKLPQDTFDPAVQEMCSRIFREIEERKINVEKYDFWAKKRARDEEERKRDEEEVKRQEEKEWERSRDKRVNAWRKFTSTKDKKNSKKRMKTFELRPPTVRTEERNPDSTSGVPRAWA